MPTLAEAASYGVPTNLNQTTSVNGTTLTWNDNGNLDASVTGGVTTDYQWTLGNRLWKVVKPASTTEYAYDSTDRRTVVIEDGVMTRTLWSGADEVGQYDQAGALVRRFIPDGSGAMDARLAMVASDGTVSWFHANHQGSVVAMSNASGAATAFANYSEYGKFGTDASGNPITAPPGGSPFGYTGRQWDAKAGLYNYRARYYDPALGVFLSMDPIGPQDDSNLYMYVGLDPVNGVDPTGEYKCEASKTQCAQIKSSLAQAEVAARRYRPGSAERRVIEAVVRYYGAEGVDNGLTVRASGREDEGAVSDTALGSFEGNENGGGEVVVYFSRLGSEDVIERLAVVMVHEGVHAADHRTGFGSDIPDMRDRLSHIETRAYVAGYRVAAALGVEGLNMQTSSEDFNRRVMMGSFASVRNACSQRGTSVLRC